ncbi:HNH endonuclease [Microbacterium phage Vitas]|uniref:HNH endonuclease n=1 Tax=Microbacterium phage Vitas TaxID=2603259 RepID=A0A5B8WLK2_9CAUD|nr:HNH endonuclease [Microbacterium phage Vitas]UOK18204.1 HNH endonuclease [Microbacterium phage Clayda5]
MPKPRSFAQDRERSQQLTALAETRWGPKRHWHCVYCGRVGYAVDHIKPTALGGSDAVWNLAPVCITCNAHKVDRDPITWMVLVGVPEGRIWNLLQAAASPTWTAPAGLTFARVELNYPAGRAARRASDPPEGKKGS